MFDESLPKFVEEAVRLRARDFNFDLSMQFREADGAAASSGNSGARIAIYGRECQQSLRNRAQYIFIEIQRALSLYPQVLNDALVNHLCGVHFTELRRQCNELNLLLENRVGHSPGRPSAGPLQTQLNEECDHLEKKYNLEIRAFVRGLTLRTEATAIERGIVIHGPVGILQTGTYASATGAQVVDSQGIDVMIRALGIVSSMLADSRLVQEEHKRQLLQVVADARTAVQQQPVNTLLLRGLFIVLCEALQSHASSEPALAALRTAALSYGISL